MSIYISVYIRNHAAGHARGRSIHSLDVLSEYCFKGPPPTQFFLVWLANIFLIIVAYFFQNSCFYNDW